jgi:putative ABC transport system permease protein
MVPKWLERFLKLFCPPSLLEEIEGDLLERYRKDAAKYSIRKAKWKLVWNALRFFRPGIVFRNHFSFKRNGMIAHYIALSFRSLLRNKAFSFINIIGLAVGLIAFFLIIQYVSFEMGFDRFHKDHELLYRVVHQQVKNGEVINSSATTFIGMRKLIYENFPGVIATGVSKVPTDLGITYGYKGKTIWQHGMLATADTAFFKVFPGILINGDAGTALTTASDFTLSEELAATTFGEKDPLHEFLEDPADLNQTEEADLLKVTGVFKNFPAESHLQFDAIGGIYSGWDTLTHYWDSPGLHTYIRVPENSNVDLMQARLNGLLSDVAKDHPNVAGAHVMLQPVTDIHLTTGIGDELTTTVDISLPLILSAIAFAILFIAWINYINLETARFVTQAKEAGIRRVIGSTRKELALQHVVRYLVLNVIAFAIASIGVVVIIPDFSYLTGIPVEHITFDRPLIWILALGLYITGSIIAGIFPALILLRLNPAAIMKGKVLPGANSGRLRTSLVVVQYVASISLIVFVVVATDQLDFIRAANRKLDLEQVIAVENPLAYSGNFEGNFDIYPALQESLRSNPAVKSMCMSSNIPGRPVNFTLVNEIKRSQSDPYDPTRFKLLFIDHNYMDLYGIKLKAGRTYEYLGEYGENDRVIVLNEAAVHALGFKSAEEAINQHIWLNLWGATDRPIVGVVEDYHHESVKEPVMPTVYYPNHNAHQQVYFSVKLNKGADVQEALTAIEAAYKKVLPQNPFAYLFIDQLYERQFQSDIHFARVFGMFSGVALFLACLGIVGITLFEANTRLREISIRKVLGSSVAGIVGILSKKHVRVIVVSLLVATPIAFYASSQWLSEYPVRIELTIAPFVIAGVSVVILTFAASVIQTLKAATTNPVDHLKNE